MRRLSSLSSTSRTVWGESAMRRSAKDGPVRPPSGAATRARGTGVNWAVLLEETRQWLAPLPFGAVPARALRVTRLIARREELVAAIALELSLDARHPLDQLIELLWRHVATARLQAFTDLATDLLQLLLLPVAFH